MRNLRDQPGLKGVAGDDGVEGARAGVEPVVWMGAGVEVGEANVGEGVGGGAAATGGGDALGGAAVIGGAEETNGGGAEDEVEVEARAGADIGTGVG